MSHCFTINLCRNVDLSIFLNFRCFEAGGSLSDISTRKHEALIIFTETFAVQMQLCVK